MEKTKQGVLDSFPKLIKGSDKERIAGGVQLVKYLSEQNWNDDTSGELNLALKRLIRGTGSANITSRKSFYVTLTAYLTTNPDTPVDKVLELMENVLQPVNNKHKSEVGEVYTGRILTCGSLVRSKLLAKSSAEEQAKVLELLITAGKKRSYLSFVAYSFIIDFLNQIDETTFANNVWPLLQQELIKPLLEQNLETLHTLLIIQEKFPSTVRKIYKKTFGSENIINTESLESITKILTEIPRIVCYRHPIYKLFIEKLSTTEYVQVFWTAIDKRFLKPSKTDEYLATELLRLLLDNVKDKALIPELLSEKYLQFMLRKCNFNKRNKKDEVTIAFKNVLLSLTTVLSENADNKIKINTLMRLIQYPGDLMIEKMTGLKIIQLFTASLDGDGIKKLSKIYKEIIENSRVKESSNGDAQTWTNVEKIYASQLLTKLLSHPEMTSNQSWRLKQLKCLFKFGLCESENFGVDLANQIKVSFYRALDNKLPKLSDLRSILSNMVSYLNEELFIKSELKLRVPLKEAGVEAWQKMMNVVKKSEGDNDKFAAFFHTMDLHMGLQLFTDPEMAISSIDELHNCFERLKKKSRKSKSKSDEDEPEWTEVVVDLLLSLLSRNEHLLRTVVGCVFPHICPHLTSVSLHQILAVLDVKNTKGPLSIKGTEDDDDSSDSEVESENEENGEKGNLNKNGKKKEDSESEDDSEKNSEGEEENKTIDSEDEDEDDDDDDLDDEEEEDETVTDRLRLAVSQALGDAAVQTDDEVDVDKIDEEEGKRLDASLAAAFKILRESRKTQMKKQSKSAETLTHFRIRVIDLLESYLDSCPSMALALDMVVPLFMLLEYCIKEPHQKPLENKVKSCLKKLAALKKFKDTDNVDNELLTTLMRLLIEKGERSASVCQEMGEQLARCCILLVRCSQQANLPMDNLAAIYVENLTAFFKKRDCILSVFFFKNILQLCWEGNWMLVPLLVEFAFDNEIRSFRRSQALELLLVFYRNARILQGDEHNEKRLKLEKKLCKKSVKLLQENVAQSHNREENSKDEQVIGKEIKQKFVVNLFTLLHAVRPHHLPQAWDWKLIAESMGAYRLNVYLAKNVKTCYNRLATQIGAPIVSSTKKKEIKAEPVNGVQNGKHDDSAVESDSEDDNKKEESANLKKKKKKANQKAKQKLKKEAKKLRAQAMEEGLESLDFSSVVLSNGTHEMDIDSEPTEVNQTTETLKHKRNIHDSQSRPSKKKKVNKTDT